MIKKNKKRKKPTQRIKVKVQSSTLLVEKKSLATIKNIIKINKTSLKSPIKTIIKKAIMLSIITKLINQKTICS